MIPFTGNPPPAAEAKFRAALRLVGEALIEWADSSLAAPAAPAPSSVTGAEPAKPPRTMPRPIGDVLVWRDGHDERLRTLAGTAPAEKVALALGVSQSTLYKHTKRLGLSLAVTRPATEIEALDSATAPRSLRGKQGMVIIDEAAPSLPLPPAEEGEPAGSAAVAPAFELVDSHHAPPFSVAPPEVAPVEAPEEIVTASMSAPRVAAAVVPEREPETEPSRPQLMPTVQDVGARPRGDMPKPNPKAPKFLPSTTGWVRLRHPDGRWLRIDCLGWVDEKKDSYHAQAKYVAAAKAKFPLAAQCVAVEEPAWRPRDIAYSGATR